MKKILWMAVGVAVVLGGCVTTDVAGRDNGVIGVPVESVIKEYKGHRVRVFDPKGKELKELPKGKSGSVSIYNKEVTGQDNYIFGKDGVIRKHLKSYGEDYSKAIWKEAK